MTARNYARSNMQAAPRLKPEWSSTTPCLNAFLLDPFPGGGFTYDLDERHHALVGTPSGVLTHPKAGGIFVPTFDWAVHTMNEAAAEVLMAACRIAGGFTPEPIKASRIWRRASGIFRDRDLVPYRMLTHGDANRVIPPGVVLVTCEPESLGRYCVEGEFAKRNKEVRRGLVLFSTQAVLAFKVTGP